MRQRELRREKATTTSPTPDNLNAPAFAKCACQHCGGPFEIPREYLGLEHECPHCKQLTRVIEERTLQPQRILPVPRPTLSIPLRKPRPSTFNLAVGFFLIVGMFAVFSGFYEEVRAETVFQQVAARLVVLGGVLAIGIAVVANLIGYALGYFWELLLSVDSVQQCLDEQRRKR